MKYLLPAIVVALVAFTGVTYGEPRVCYSCNSQNNKNCKLNAVNVSLLDLGDCKLNKKTSSDDETVCYKVSGTVNAGTPKGTFVERGCTLKKNATGTDFCSIMKESANEINATDVLCSICTKDLCNSSSLFMGSFTVILMSFMPLLKL